MLKEVNMGWVDNVLPFSFDPGGEVDCDSVKEQLEGGPILVCEPYSVGFI